MIELAAALLLSATAPSFTLAQPLGASDAPAAAPEETDRQAEVRDRVQYKQLTREIIRIDRVYAQKLDEAVGQARTSTNGEASLELQADMLSLRDRRDRLLNRLMLLSLRHGWEVPDFEAEAAKAEDAAPDEGVNAVFARSSAMVRGEFAKEAQAIAQSIDLPVISLTIEH